MGFFPDGDIERSQQVRHRRQILIERFTEDQRRKRNWINFAEIADWCSDLNGPAPNDSVRVDAYRKLQQALLDGDFEQDGPAGVRLLHPKMFKRIQREYARTISAIHEERLRSDVLPYCWLSRDLFERWCAKHHLPASPPRFQPKQQNASPTSPIYKTGLPGRPTSIHLIRQEFLARAERNETKERLVQEADALSAWLKKAHPAAAPVKSKTIQNALRDEFRSLLKSKKAQK
jgi:hypothetical protein